MYIYGVVQKMPLVAVEVSKCYFSEKVVSSLTLLGWLQAQLQEILRFVSYKRSIIGVINILVDIKNKRQRTVFVNMCKNIHC